MFVYVFIYIYIYIYDKHRQWVLFFAVSVIYLEYKVKQVHNICKQYDVLVPAAQFVGIVGFCVTL